MANNQSSSVPSHASVDSSLRSLEADQSNFLPLGDDRSFYKDAAFISPIDGWWSVLPAPERLVCWFK